MNHPDLTQYSLCQEFNDERFGFISLLQSKKLSSSICMKERTEQDPRRKLKEMSSYLSTLNSAFLTIYNMEINQRSNTIQVYFENCLNEDLSKQISRHKQQRTRFSRAELYVVLYSALCGLSCLERNKKTHGYIVPSTLFRICKDVYKMHDNFTITKPRSLYAEALKGQCTRYLAPELVKDLLERKETPSNYNANKADIFSLGMCILEAGLLGIDSDFLHKQSGSFNEIKLEKAMYYFEKAYSGSIVDILKEMLCFNKSKRPSASELLFQLAHRKSEQTQINNAIDVQIREGQQTAVKHIPSILASNYTLQDTKTTYNDSKYITKVPNHEMIRTSEIPRIGDSIKEAQLYRVSSPEKYILTPEYNQKVSHPADQISKFTYETPKRETVKVTVHCHTLS